MHCDGHVIDRIPLRIAHFMVFPGSVYTMQGCARVLRGSCPLAGPLLITSSAHYVTEFLDSKEAMRGARRVAAGCPGHPDWSMGSRRGARARAS